MSTQTELQTILTVEEQLRVGLRQAAVQHLLADPKTTTHLAVAFDVPESSIQAMFAAPWWELPLAIDVAQVLGLSLTLRAAESPLEGDVL